MLIMKELYKVQAEPLKVCWYRALKFCLLGKFSTRSRDGAEFQLRLGRQIVVPSIVGFGSETSSRNQAMQCCCLLSKDGISGVPKRCIAVIVYMSTCFDESSSWGNADWSCSTLLGFVVADFKCLQHYRRKQCHAVFARLDWVTKCL